MTAKKYSCMDILAKPHSRNATMLLPSALANMTQGYGNRSLRWPSRIWPPTAEELKTDSTVVAVRGEEIAVVKLAMYRDTGKYENP